MSLSNGQIGASPPPVQPPTIYQHLYTQQKPPQFIQVVTPDGNVGSIFAAHAKPETLEALKQCLSLKHVNTSPVESGMPKYLFVTLWVPGLILTQRGGQK